jgi:hypothetical protein
MILMRKPMAPNRLMPRKQIFIDLHRSCQLGFVADLRSLEADSKKDRIPKSDHVE